MSSADEAIGVLEERDDIRAVFTNVQMPGSMDGIGLVRIVRERWPAVAALVTSGKTSMMEGDLPSEVPFIPKPYMAAQIDAALRELIA